MMSGELGPARRAALGRLMSRIARDENGMEGMEPCPVPAPRIGITGPPGAGKSTLIGPLVGMRVKARQPLGILAVDPTSPRSRGSVLGDRIRMDAIAADPRVFIRSLPSLTSHDGLCSNIEALLRVFEREGFAEIILETVGVGQGQHTIRAVTDTVIVVMPPNAGDSIQAMKAGLMELADIYVVNKSDLADAKATAADIRAIVRVSSAGAAWTPPVLLASGLTGAGVAELSEAIDHHLQTVAARKDPAAVASERLRYHVGEVLQRRLANTIDAADPSLWSRPLGEIIESIARGGR